MITIKNKIFNKKNLPAILSITAGCVTGAIVLTMNLAAVKADNLANDTASKTISVIEVDTTSIEPDSEDIASRYIDTDLYASDTESTKDSDTEIETEIDTVDEVSYVEIDSSNWSNNTDNFYEASYLRYAGVINWNGYLWTWYTTQEFPGQHLGIPGRSEDENGYICDENDYICIASSDLSKGTVIDTPFGKQGKIYDCGCSHGVLDVYVNWTV